MQETQGTRVWSLSWEDALEEEIATHSGFLPGKFHEPRSLVDYRPWSHKESDTTEHIHTLTCLDLRKYNQQKIEFINKGILKIISSIFVL